MQEYGGFGAMHLFMYAYVCAQYCLGNFFGLNLIRNEKMLLRYLNDLKVHENMKMNGRGGSINSVERLKCEFKSFKT